MTHNNEPPLFSNPYEGFLELQARREAQMGVEFDPSELLQLATEQWPFRPLVAASFALCTKAWTESVLYTHFLGFTEREELDHAGGAILEHPTLGGLAVDFAFDARVEGGVRVVGVEDLERSREVFEGMEQRPEIPMLRVAFVKGQDTSSKLSEAKSRAAGLSEAKSRSAGKQALDHPPVPFRLDGQCGTGNEEMGRNEEVELFPTWGCESLQRAMTMWTAMEGVEGIEALRQEEKEVVLFEHHLEYELDYLDWYHRKNDTVGLPFDPTELMQLAMEQWPTEPKVAPNFALCTAEWPRNELYTNFVCDQDRNLYRHAGCAFLRHPTLGELVIDVAHDASAPGGFRITGMEYLSRVMAQGGEAKARRK